ncbi:MAG: hypothetical protein ACI89D_000977 [Bermanella sp.]|jgi:hypothetical protein
MRSLGLRQQLLLFALLPLLLVSAGTGLSVLRNYHVEVEIFQEQQALLTARDASQISRACAPSQRQRTTSNFARQRD